MPTAMITGAGRGLGSALAEVLAPTHTLFLAGRPSSRLDEVVGNSQEWSLPSETWAHALRGRPWRDQGPKVPDGP